MKYIIFIIIITAAAVGIIAWFQAKPLGESRVSVSTPAAVKTPAQEAQAIDIGNQNDGFQSIDADIAQL